MSLADQVRDLETLLERGEIDRDEFETRLTQLIRASSGSSSDTTRPDVSPAVRMGRILGGPTPTHIGAYELIELLGQGGMGAVYLAKHLLLPGLFAVKVPRHELLTQEGFGRRFKREASVGLKLDHPGIVRVHDLVIDGDWAAIVMQFVAGPNLETLLRNHGGPLPRERVLDLMVQLLDAMEYAHDEGVIHRDLKPKNLIVRPSGQLQVTDFGVAWLQGIEETQATTAGMVGTAPYMAPELYTGQCPIDRRADIYAIGMTLYKLLVGHLPFSGDMNSYQILRAKEEGTVPLPSAFVDHLPPGIVEVVAHAIHPDPDMRFATCAELKEALIAGSGDDWVPRAVVPMRLVEQKEPPRPPAPRASPLQYALVTLVAALFVAVVWLSLEVHRQAETLAVAPAPVVETKTEALLPPEAAEPEIVDAVADPTPGTFDEADAANPEPETRREPAEQWPELGTSGGGLPAPREPDLRTSRGDAAPPQPASEFFEGRELAVIEPATATPDSVPGAAEPVTAAPDPALGGTRIAIAEPPLPEPGEPEMGLLYLAARPRSRVEVDGHPYGTTDDTRTGLVLPPGSHKVRFVCDHPDCEGFDRRSGVKTLEVLAGEKTRYLADFYTLNRD